MIEELVTIRVLVVSGSNEQRRLLREGADQAPYPTEVRETDNLAGAAPKLAEGNIDMVLLDAGLPAADKVGICQAARAAKPGPFVVALGESADLADVDANVARPSNADEAKAILERYLNTRVPARVMVVDDSATMRSIVRKTLMAGKFPVEVVEVDEGMKALQVLRSRKFDLVFLDFNMPGLNGFETMAELRREHPALNVVIMTSTDNVSFAERARQAGAAFLKKPFFPPDIDAVLYRFHKIEQPRRA